MISTTLWIFYCAIVIVNKVIATSDFDYDLNIGNSIDIFANYGDLSQVTQVVSADYDDFATPFNERNIQVFVNPRSRRANITDEIDEAMSFLFCDTFEVLLDSYFKDFYIEGTEKPWKAFMGDWIIEEIMRTLGLEYDPNIEPCCFTLVKICKTHKAESLDALRSNVTPIHHVKLAINKINASNPAEIRKFMTSYGTHYIQSYTTGNAIYQVFVHKREAYMELKREMKKRTSQTLTTDDLRYYFSSYFLRQIGEIRVASGNKTIEKWAKDHLRDGRYMYLRPSMLRLHYNSTLVGQLNQQLDDSALLSLKLKILKPLFHDEFTRTKYVETVDNEMKLWEING